MMNVRIDERHAYVELEVFGRYQLDRFGEVIDAMRGLSQRHGGFSVLEIHHGKVDNLLSAVRTISKSGNAEAYEFMKTMRKYALVSDNPSFLIRMSAMLASSSKYKLRLFPIHERDMARQWIEERTPQI